MKNVLDEYISSNRRVAGLVVLKRGSQGAMRRISNGLAALHQHGYGHRCLCADIIGEKGGSIRIILNLERSGLEKKNLSWICNQWSMKKEDISNRWKY